MATLIEQFTTYHSLELDFTLSLLSLVSYMFLSIYGPLVLTLLYIADQTRRAYRLRPVYYVIVTAAAAAAVSTAADARYLWL
jgi:hypothetical protein